MWVECQAQPPEAVNLKRSTLSLRASTRWLIKDHQGETHEGNDENVSEPYE